MSYNGGGLYTGSLTPDGSGTYNLSGVVSQSPGIGFGPEGLAYVPTGSPQFTNPNGSALISFFSAGSIVAYDLNTSGVIDFTTGRNFITGLTGAEGGFVDPITGDFLFSTFGGGNHVIVVGGFAAPVVPEPSSMILTGLGLAVLGGVAWRRRRTNLP